MFVAIQSLMDFTWQYVECPNKKLTFEKGKHKVMYNLWGGGEDMDTEEFMSVITRHYTTTLKLSSNQPAEY